VKAVAQPNRPARLNVQKVDRGPQLASSFLHVERLHPHTEPLDASGDSEQQRPKAMLVEISLTDLLRSRKPGSTEASVHHKENGALQETVQHGQRKTAVQRPTVEEVKKEVQETVKEAPKTHSREFIKTRWTMFAAMWIGCVILAKACAASVFLVTFDGCADCAQVRSVLLHAKQPHLRRAGPAQGRLLKHLLDPGLRRFCGFSAACV
jgi:hypothetical protein